MATTEPTNTTTDHAPEAAAPAAQVDDAGVNAADDDDDEYTGIGHIPAQLVQSTESDTVRFRVGGQGDMEDACSPDHARAGLFSPTFHGGEVTYSRSDPPVPAALLRAAADGASSAPLAATSTALNDRGEGSGGLIG